MRCNQCQAAMINGVFCHETGCPNTRKRYRDGEWITVYTCRECGCETDANEGCSCSQTTEDDYGQA